MHETVFLFQTLSIKFKLLFIPVYVPHNCPSLPSHSGPVENGRHDPLFQKSAVVVFRCLEISFREMI